ncbi:MAG: hypothetical protein GX921_04230 [Bacteroidales bacterium]|nr:hypothetical protein [Bacteroidales bacterium]
MFKTHRFLLGALFLLIILSVEVYFIDIVPFVNGERLLVAFLALSLLFLLFYLILLLVGLPWAFFNKMKVSAAGLPERYGFRFVGGLFAWLSVLTMVVFQPFYRVEVLNKTGGDIGNVMCSASFGNGVAKKPLESLGINKSKSFTVRGLGALGNFAFDDKAVVKFLQNDKLKWVSGKSSFLRTKVVIRDYSVSNPKAMDCEEDVYDFHSGGGGMTMGINLCSEWMEMDTIALSYVSNSSIEYIVVNTPYENRIKRVERVLHWYPSVWSKMDDDLLQYTKLTNLKYVTTDEMKVLNLEEERYVISPDVIYGNVIRYVNPNRADYDLSVFKAISKDEVVEHLRTQLNKSKKGYDPLTNAEIEQWMGYLDGYDKGSFLNDDWHHFRVHYYDIYLRVTFEGDDGDFVKVLHNWVHVGN